MKSIYRICGKISILSYVFVLFQMWHLCQYGMNRKYLLMLALGTLVFLVSFILWLFTGKYQHKNAKIIFRIEIMIILISTVYFGGRIVYSAMPYNGALSWKLDEWMRKKEVRVQHDNFFKDGVEGVLTDLDAALDLPEELYIVNQFKMTFDATGAVKTIDTFLYGRNRRGQTKTYLVTYDADVDEYMTVWVDGEANETYEEDMYLEPMLAILQAADCQNQVEAWYTERGPETYEILYYGRRSFTSEEGLRYLEGDANGDGAVTGISSFEQLKNGGEVVGFELSLHIPGAEAVTPVRYIMEPEYMSQGKLNEEQEEQQTEAAKEAESWTVDAADGSMYFYLNSNKGWRLVVADAAAGSRFYELERTKDGGASWEKANADPFEGMAGVSEGLIFFDDNFGFAGLSGAASSVSSIYMTRDGGETLTKLQLPMDTVTEPPEHAEEYGLTLEDYDYLYMPKLNEGILTILVVTAAGETEGLLFQSQDMGRTWVFAGP